MTGGTRPNPSNTELANLAASGTLPGRTATEAAGDCVYVSINQAIPVVQNCNGEGSGSTTVNAGAHPYGLAYDTSNSDVYVTDYKSGTVSVVSNLAVVGTVNVGGSPIAAAFDGTNNDVYVANAGLNVLYEKNLQTGAATKHVYADGEQVAAITDRWDLLPLPGRAREHEAGDERVLEGLQQRLRSLWGRVRRDRQRGVHVRGDALRRGDGALLRQREVLRPEHGDVPHGGPDRGRELRPAEPERLCLRRDNPLAIVDPSGLSWSNPSSWTFTQALLTGAAIGLTILAATELGLNPILDTLDASAVQAAAASFAVGAAVSTSLNLVSNAALGGGIGWNQAGWSFGFAVVGLAAGIGGEESAPMVGQEGVREVQIDLASVGRITEQGWVAYPAESRFLNPGVQIDLLDLASGDMYDAKKGPSGGGAGIQVELERQMSIVGQTVELRNTITGKVHPES